MSFILFAIIIVFTAVQTFVLRDRDRTRKERRGTLGRALRVGNQRNPRAGGMP